MCYNYSNPYSAVINHIYDLWISNKLICQSKLASIVTNTHDSTFHMIINVNSNCFLLWMTLAVEMRVLCDVGTKPLGSVLMTLSSGFNILNHTLLAYATLKPSGTLCHTVTWHTTFVTWHTTNIVTHPTLWSAIWEYHNIPLCNMAHCNTVMCHTL
jgi:hypothetical protein